LSTDLTPLENEMIIYYCWITAMLPSYQDGIIAGLARKGYMVGPASKDGAIATGASDTKPSVLFAVSVYKAEETNASNIYTDVIAVLNDMKARYYSVIISHSYEATWAGSNIKLPGKPPPIPPQDPSSKKLN
jgi:hypothetical protein